MKQSSCKTHQHDRQHHRDYPANRKPIAEWNIFEIFYDDHFYTLMQMNVLGDSQISKPVSRGGSDVRTEENLLSGRSGLGCSQDWIGVVTRSWRGRVNGGTAEKGVGDVAIIGGKCDGKYDDE